MKPVYSSGSLTLVSGRKATSNHARKNTRDQDIRDNILVIENKKPNCSQIHCFFFSFLKDILANCNPQATGPINYYLLFLKKKKKKKNIPPLPSPWLFWHGDFYLFNYLGSVHAVAITFPGLIVLMVGISIKPPKKRREKFWRYCLLVELALLHQGLDLRGPPILRILPLRRAYPLTF